MKTSSFFQLALSLPLLTIPLARATAPTPRPEAYVPVLMDRRLAGSALVKDGVAYLPLRSVAKYLGLTVNYNADANMIIVKTPRQRGLGGIDKPPVE